MPSPPRVGLAKQGSRRDNVRAAMDLVRDDLVPKVAEQVLLKPNFLSSKNQLASTHPDAIRGAIDFLLSVPRPPKEILIAEGGNEEHSGQAFENFGYHALKAEFDVPITLVDLNQETRWDTVPITLDNGFDYLVHTPRTVLDCPCTISVAIAKTHDVCVVTLALKNMIMGTIRKQDRVKMHGYPTHKERRRPNESQVLNVNLIRLARHLSPNIAVVDGTVGLQGNGPGGTDAVDLGIAAAGTDVFAVDAVVTKVMGWDPMALGLSHYGHTLGMGVADIDRIDVLGERIEDVARAFTPHEWTPEQLQWHTGRAQEIGIR